MGRNTAKILIVVFLSIFNFYFLIFILSPQAFGDISCQPIYGGGQTCIASGNILVNKKVLNPSANALVDNLGINDPKYYPGFIVNFRLEVTNTGSATIDKVEVKDIFPQYVEFNSGPGNFDQDTKTLTYSLDSLGPNETRASIIIGRVVASDQLPASQGIVCVVNQATAVTSNNGNSQDNSQFCIENKAIPTPVVTTKGGFPILSPVPVTSTPATGPEALGLVALIPTGIAGWFLRKMSMGKNMTRLHSVLQNFGEVKGGEK